MPSLAVIEGILGSVPDQQLRASLVAAFSELFSAPPNAEDLVGELPDAVIPDPLPAVSGENLTDLNAAELDGVIPISSLPSPIPVANLPSNIAFTDLQNTFTKNQFLSVPGAAILWLIHSDGPVDLRKYRIITVGGSFYIQQFNDAETVATTPLQLSAVGDAFVQGMLQTGNRVFVNSAYPMVLLRALTDPVNSRDFDVENWGQQLRIVAYNDDRSVASGGVSVSRTGRFDAPTVVTNGFDISNLRAGNLAWDTIPQARFPGWVDIPYNPAAFWASSGTWSVSSGGYTWCSYNLTGKTLTMRMYFSGTVIDTPCSWLYMALPGGLVIRGYATNFMHFANGGWGHGFAYCQNGSNYIMFGKTLDGATLWQPDGGAYVTTTLVTEVY